MPSSGFMDPMVQGDLYITLDQDQDQDQDNRRRSFNMTECVSVPTSEHVAEIVGRQGCKIKALRSKTNTYIKTPVRGEEPVFMVTGRRGDVAMARREIISAAEHFSLIRASRNRNPSLTGGGASLPPAVPGQTTIQVRVPYRVVGLVVGPKGATVKRIQQQTLTYIVTPSRDKDPVFEVTGTPDNVDRARDQIQAHIAMRTGGLVEGPAQDDNDFHANGTDVGLDLQVDLWSRTQTGTRCNDSSSSLGSSSPDCSLSPAPSYTNMNLSINTNGNSFEFRGAESPDSTDLMFDLSPAPPGLLWPQYESHPGDTPPMFNTAYNANEATARQREAPPTEHALAQRGGGASLTLHTYSGCLLPGGPSSSSSSSSSSSGTSRRESRDCSLCFGGVVTAALVPCGHDLFCMECANRICGRSQPRCPVCHVGVTQAIRIFT